MSLAIKLRDEGLAQVEAHGPRFADAAYAAIERIARRQLVLFTDDLTDELKGLKPQHPNAFTGKFTRVQERAVTDQWQWWRDALAGNRGPLHDEPMSGFYETRRRDRKTGVVSRGVIAYWLDPTGKLCCKRDGNMIEDLPAREQWPFACTRPIAKTTHDQVRAGGGWPDEIAAAKVELSNSAGAELDDLATLRDRVDDLAQEADRITARGAAKTAEESTHAADLATRLLRLEQQCEARRKALREPFDLAASKIDSEWKPARDKAAERKSSLKRIVVTPFEVAEKKRTEAATIARREAAWASGLPAPSVAAPPRTISSISTVALRKVHAAKITDYAKTLAYFAHDPRVVELIQSLANAAARQGQTPDGCEITTTEVAA